MKQLVIILIMMMPFRVESPQKQYRETEVKFKVEVKLETLNEDIQDLIHIIEENKKIKTK